MNYSKIILDENSKKKKKEDDFILTVLHYVDVSWITYVDGSVLIIDPHENCSELKVKLLFGDFSAAAQ